MEEELLRVPLPKKNQVLGIVETRLGYGKSRIRCTDGKTRLCKVPGHLKRRLWVRPGDVVLVEPWEIEGDRKGNIVLNYKPNQRQWLEKQGYLKKLIEVDEF
jgi:translation initiation factor 1A